MIAIGFLGNVLDAAGGRHKRWDRWRPSVALCQHDNLLITRYELLYHRRDLTLANRTKKDIELISPETQVILRELSLKNPWDFEEVYSKLLDFARVQDFKSEEDYLIHITTGTHVAQICMFLLTEAQYFPGRLIQTSPDRKNGVSGQYTIIDLDLSKYDQINSRFQAEQEEATSFLKSGITTLNKNFNQMIDRIEKVCIKTKAPILLTGPTGAGKSHLAKRIFDLKKIKHQVEGEFIEVNCATLKGDGAMSALFGHKKGSFTGAGADRAGLLKSADKGVLFLDEIGELGLDEQAMILRAVEEKKFLPVGADHESSSDFQLLAGTNRDLTVEVTKGRFREDLLARINLWSFEMPALKDRREDILPNIEYEMAKYAEMEGQKVSFNKEARAKYLQFALSGEAIWSANFRDLSASITRMATLSDKGRIAVDEVEVEITRLKSNWRSSHVQENLQILEEFFTETQVDELDLFDQIQLSQVIAVCKSSHSTSAAGRKLFAATRSKKKVSNDADRLSKYLKKFNLTWKDLSPDIL